MNDSLGDSHIKVYHKSYLQVTDIIYIIHNNNKFVTTTNADDEGQAVGIEREGTHITSWTHD